MFNKLLHNIRFYILLFSALFAAATFVIVTQQDSDQILQAIKLDKIYALTSVGFLYLALIISPLFRIFTTIPFKQQILKSRRAIGVSAFIYASLHVYFAFFKELNGFSGLRFLDDRYLMGVILGAVPIFILFLMAATSFDYIIAKLTFKKWKILHKFVYLAGLLVLIHIMLLGSDFIDLSQAIPQIFFIAISILLGLEAVRLDRFLRNKFGFLSEINIVFSLFLVLVTGSAVYVFAPTGNNKVSPLNIHAAHIQLAQQAQEGFANPSIGNLPLSNIPGLNGDRTKRYTASFLHPDNVQPNQDTTLRFRINDASSGIPITLFLRTYAYPMHLMIVDSTLTYFNHIHPTEQDNGEFDITTQFPKPGLYHLYIQIQPLGGIEQQFAFTLPVGVLESDKPAPSTQEIDKNLTKTFGDYEVTLDTHGTLKAADMSLGKDQITFTIKDAKTKASITTLKPFMAAFGHLTMINQQTYDFIHVHPTNLVAPAQDANGGPTVDFLPIGIYGPFKPGIYRVFGEFSTKIGTDFDADFTIDVK